MSDYKPSDQDLIALVRTHAQYNSIFDNEKVYLTQIANRLEARGKENADQEIKLENLKSEIRRLHSVIYDRGKGTYSPIRTRTDTPPPPPKEE